MLHHPLIYQNLYQDFAILKSLSKMLLQGLQMRATVGVTGNFRGERSEAECPRQADQGVARERGHSLRSGKTGQQRPEVTGLRTLKYTGRACTDLISGTVEDLGQPLDDGLQQAEQGRRAAGDI